MTPTRTGMSLARRSSPASRSGRFSSTSYSDRAAAQVSDLLVGQIAVLPQQEDLLFFLAEVADGPAQPLERFLMFEDLAGRGILADHGKLLGAHGLGAAMPGAALHILGGVEADAEDPGAEIEDLAELV